MSVISVQNVAIRFRGPQLLDDVNCEIESGQKIGLLGRNGAGKSTFLKLLDGQLEPDSGNIVTAPGTRVAYLDQHVPLDKTGAIFSVVADGMTEHGEPEHWESKHVVDQVLSKMDLDGSLLFETLSSGMKRRVLLAQALVGNPDVLLLDEPTNHLDLEAIGWLEQFLSRFVDTFVFVTHDRMFLQKMANRIVEIDRGHLFDWSCDYQTFLKRKEQAMAAEDKQNALFDKRLAEEEAWIRSGIKARRTRNEGRVRALKEMRNQRRQRREKTGTSKLQIQEGQRSGNLVIAAEDIRFKYENHDVIPGFSTVIMRGDKVGIIGKNGVGKTTLLKILLGQLKPDSGTVKLGSNLRIAYFDQLRQQLDEEKTVQENVGEGNDQIQIGDSKKHVLGYLQDFLFTPERARTQVKFLSGGERNRILLAKLFAKPANLIVLDEPTNDLDTETLELLEEKLIDFNGTVLLVSHDRAFLNHVVTSTIAFEAGGVNEYDGGYDDWLRQSPPGPPPAPAEKKPKTSTKPGRNNDGPRKLKYKEKLELEELPERIESLESTIAQLHQQMSDPDFYKRPKEEIALANEKLKSSEADLESAYHRWEELESLQA